MPPANSDGRRGLVGVTLRGPVCRGPARLNQPLWHDAPSAAALKLPANDGALLARFSAGPDRRFRLALPPGRCSVASDLSGLFPRLAPVPVEAPAQTFVSLRWHFDTGRR